MSDLRRSSEHWRQNVIVQSRIMRPYRSRSCCCGDQNGRDDCVVARFVKVLKIERVVPNLLDRRVPKPIFANLEFDDEQNAVDHKHDVNTPADSGNGEFKEHAAASGVAGKLFA